jgi:four helix bundle protein
MKIERFEDIASWKKAREVTERLYHSLQNCRDYGFKDQIQRASVSIMNNIAEGFERHGDTEFKHFLYISKGSCGEVRSMLYLACDLGYVEKDTSKKLLIDVEEISRMISGLIKTLH